MKDPFIVAHRGSSYAAPENTLPAFKLAFDEEADFIEADFWLTKDNQIVCIHDPNTKRITKRKFNLDVRQSTLAELKEINVISWKDGSYANISIPTLREVLDVIPDTKGIFIEIKDNRERFVLKLVEEIDNLAFPRNRIRIISFNTNSIKLSKKYLPDVKTYWLFSSVLSKNDFVKSFIQKRIIKKLDSINCDGVDLFYAPYVDECLASCVKERKLDFCVFNVESVETAARIKNLEVYYITTNSPLLIRNALLNNLKMNKTETTS